MMPSGSRSERSRADLTKGARCGRSGTGKCNARAKDGVRKGAMGGVVRKMRASDPKYATLAETTRKARQPPTFRQGESGMPPAHGRRPKGGKRKKASMIEQGATEWRETPLPDDPRDAETGPGGP